MLNWVSNKLIDYKLVESYLSKTIESRQFTNYGPNVRLLEERIRKLFYIDDEKAVIVVNNGSIAIHILATAIQYKDKKNIQWATQSFTFPPSAQANLQNAIIVDIDLEGGINLDEIDESIDGIIITNIFGNVVDIDKYEKWAKEKNKYVIYDNAATCYTFYKGKNCINYGTGCSISFHHTKPFGFGEGGAIIIDKKYENEVRCLINFGINLSDEYYVKEGTNGKMSDIAAVYILQYWDKYFDIIIEKHNKLYEYFKEQIKNKNITYFKLFPSFHDNQKNVPACLSILFDNYNDKYETVLLQNNIFCRKYYQPLKNTKNSQYIHEHILCIPCNIDMIEKDIDKILDIIDNIFKLLI
jgi:dTDP-4-amino-4,6-dideoxygalactose transaminase